MTKKKKPCFGPGSMREMQRHHGRSATIHLDDVDPKDVELTDDDRCDSDLMDERWVDHIDPIFYER